MNNFFKKYLEFHETYYQESFIIILDHEFKVAFVGDEFLTVTGKTRKQTLGKHLHESAQIPEKIKFCPRLRLVRLLSRC